MGAAPVHSAQPTVTRHMQAIRLHEVRQPVRLDALETPTPGTDQAVIEIQAAALNRRDYWITQGMYPGMSLPCTLGSDGAGKVLQTGDNVDSSWVGREVIVNPGIQWGANEAHQSSEFEILGMPRAGTAATHLLVEASWLHDKPTHLTAQQAAALPLAGVTAFRSVFTRGQLSAGETMLVTGIGGGVATLALQFGVAAGAKVLVTSSSAEKLQQATQMGAADGFNYREEGWQKAVRKNHGHPDVIIDSAGGTGYAHLVDIAGPGGRIVNYGAHHRPHRTDRYV